LLEMEESQQKKLSKLIKTKPFHQVDPEVKEMRLEQRKGRPRIIDIHTHPYTKVGWRSLGKFRVYLDSYLYGRSPLLASMAEATPNLIDALKKAIPILRLAKPEDIAAAVAFIVLDEASYITGQTLSVSGGLTMV